jgi:hypothetical protein
MQQQRKQLHFVTWLTLAGQLGCSRLEIDSDCMDVVDTMQNGGNSIGGAAAIYEHCSFLAPSFTHVKISHCPMKSNVVAHTLACNAVGPQAVTWFEDPPVFPLSSLANNVSLFDN